MNVQSKEANLPSISDYYSATQLRADRWSALRECIESMHMHGIEGRQGKKLLATAEQLFDALAPIWTSATSTICRPPCAAWRGR